MKNGKNITLILFLAALPSMMPASRGVETQVHNYKVEDNKEYEQAQPGTVTSAQKDLSPAQKIAVQTRNVLAKTGIANKGWIDSLAGTQDVTHSDGTLDLTSNQPTPILVYAEPQTEINYFGETPTSNQPEATPIESPQITVPLSPYEMNFIGNVMKESSSVDAKVNDIASMIKEKTENQDLSPSLNRQFTDFLKRQINTLPSLPTRQELKNFVDNGVIFIKNLTNQIPTIRFSNSISSEAETFQNRADILESAEKDLKGKLVLTENNNDTKITITRYLKTKNSSALIQLLLYAPAEPKDNNRISRSLVWNAITSKMADATGLTALRARLNPKEQNVLDTSLNKITDETASEIDDTIKNKSATQQKIQSIIYDLSEKLKNLASRLGWKNQQDIQNEIFLNQANNMMIKANNLEQE